MCAHDRIEVLAALNLAFELPDKAAADAAEAAAGATEEDVEIYRPTNSRITVSSASNEHATMKAR